MSFLDLFRKKRKTGTRKHRRSVSSRQNFQRIIKDIRTLQTQAIATDTILRKHGQEITRHGTLLEKHCEQLDSLEQLVVKAKVYPTNIDFPTVNRPDIPPGSAVSTPRPSQPAQMVPLAYLSSR